jgi:hypothetical protein
MMVRPAPRRLALAALAAVLAACSTPAARPRPLPAGPPPEYEPPRPFDLPQASATSSGTPGAAPAEPRPKAEEPRGAPPP